eukprot:5851835-Lingulodinium_polyedra.AAC.1
MMLTIPTTSVTERGRTHAHEVLFNQICHPAVVRTNLRELILTVYWMAYRGCKELIMLPVSDYYCS